MQHTNDLGHCQAITNHSGYLSSYRSLCPVADHKLPAKVTVPAARNPFNVQQQPNKINDYLVSS